MSITLSIPPWALWAAGAAALVGLVGLAYIAAYAWLLTRW